jgi:WD40 repeat protein
VIFPVVLFAMTLKLMSDTDNKPKTLTGSLLFQRAKQITSTDDLFHGIKKKTVLGVAYAEKMKCLCLITADRYLLTIAFRDNADLLLKDFSPHQYDIIRYQFTEHAQTGIVYSSSMNVIITWAGEDERCLLRIWHIEELSLLETMSIHKDRILDCCDVYSRVDRNYMVSCDNQAKVYVWSVKLRSSTASSTSVSSAKPLTKEVPISMQLRAEVPAIDAHNAEGLIEKYQLKGHNRSIRCLAFASQSGMVIGAGFDFEVNCLYI